MLNNGTESRKGDPLRKETYELLAADESLNFIGNVEARDLMNGVADVVVADGFTGNAVLKSIEGTAMGIMDLLKTAITGGGLLAKLGALLLKDSLRGLKNSSTTQMLVEQSCLVSRHRLSRLMAASECQRLFIVQSARFVPC